MKLKSSAILFSYAIIAALILFINIQFDGEKRQLEIHFRIGIIMFCVGCGMICRAIENKE